MLTQAHGKVLNEGVVGVGVDPELGPTCFLNVTSTTETRTCWQRNGLTVPGPRGATLGQAPVALTVPHSRACRRRRRRWGGRYLRGDGGRQAAWRLEPSSGSTPTRAT